MKSIKGSKTAEAEMEAPTATGRHGAIDFAANSQLSKPHAEIDVVSAEDHIYRVIELVGTSQKSVEDAINTAIFRAQKTVRNLRWFEVARTSGHIADGKVSHFQVTLKVGFTMEGAS